MPLVQVVYYQFSVLIVDPLGSSLEALKRPAFVDRSRLRSKASCLRSGALVRQNEFNAIDVDGWRIHPGVSQIGPEGKRWSCRVW